MRRVRPFALYHVAMRRLEADFIRWYLREAKGSVAGAAKMLGVPANFIYRRMERLGLEVESERQAATKAG